MGSYDNASGSWAEKLLTIALLPPVSLLFEVWLECVVEKCLWIKVFQINKTSRDWPVIFNDLRIQFWSLIFHGFTLKAFKNCTNLAVLWTFIIFWSFFWKEARMDDPKSCNVKSMCDFCETLKTNSKKKVTLSKQWHILSPTPSSFFGMTKERVSRKKKKRHYHLVHTFDTVTRAGARVAKFFGWLFFQTANLTSVTPENLITCSLQAEEEKKTKINSTFIDYFAERQIWSTSQWIFRWTSEIPLFFYYRRNT